VSVTQCAFQHYNLLGLQCYTNGCVITVDQLTNITQCAVVLVCILAQCMCPVQSSNSKNQIKYSLMFYCTFQVVESGVGGWYVVAQPVEALLYKLEGRGFDSRLGH
jgi:hypothetical protein